jgi:hypothetical protein
MSPTLLGLAGYAGCGKDALAEAMRPAGWSRVALADRIRAVAYDLDPTVAHAVDDTSWDEAKRDVPYVREYYQFLGQVMRANLGADVWLNAALAQLPPGLVVVTDVRMPNEADAIVDAGGQVIRITRPGVGPVNGHVTEQALDGYDFDGWFVNDRTPAALASEVLLWLKGRW